MQVAGETGGSSSSRGKPWPPAAQGNIQCKYCGRSHPAKSCPAYEKQCNRCKGWNHFAIMHEHRTATVDRQVRMVNNEQYEDNECLYLGSLFWIVHAHTPNDDDWMTNVVIGRQQISFKLVTGAQANVLPMKMFEGSIATYTNYPVGICQWRQGDASWHGHASVHTRERRCADVDRVLCDQPHQPTITRMSNM